MLRLVVILIQLAAETARWWGLACRSQRSIEAENLFLRRQLALYIERGVKRRRVDSLTRIALVLLSRLFNWRDALVVVRPETMIRWHRAGWKLLWRRKSAERRHAMVGVLETERRRKLFERIWCEYRLSA
jgi:putative transposase